MKHRGHEFVVHVTWMPKCQEFVQRQTVRIGSGRFIPHHFIFHNLFFALAIEFGVPLSIDVLDEIVAVAACLQKIRIIFVPRNESVAWRSVNFGKDYWIASDRLFDVLTNSSIYELCQFLDR